MCILSFVQSCALVLNKVKLYKETTTKETPLSGDKSTVCLVCDGFVTYNRIVYSKFDTSAKTDRP